MVKATGLLDSLGAIPNTGPAKFNDKIKLSDTLREFVEEKRKSPIGKRGPWIFKVFPRNRPCRWI